METLTPQHRQPESWKGWLQHAIALHRRRAGRHIILVAGILIAAYWLGQVRGPLLPVLVMLTSGPLVLGLFTAGARRADVREGGAGGRLDKVVVRLAALGLLCWMLLACLFALSVGLIRGVAALAGLDGVSPLPMAAGAPPVERGVYEQLLIGSVFFVVLPVTVYLVRGFWFLFPGWFFVPLLVCARLPMAEAYALSRRGEHVSRGAVLRVSVLSLVLLLMVALSGGILAAFVLPLLGALQYVSYRDVFLGRRENSPQPVRHTYSLALFGASR